MGCVPSLSPGVCCLTFDSAEKPLHKNPGLTEVGKFFYPSLLLRSFVHRQTKRLTCSVYLSVRLHGSFLPDVGADGYRQRERDEHINID